MGIEQNLCKMTLSFEGHLLLMLVITFVVISKLIIIQLLTACGYWPKFVPDDLVFWRSFIVDARDYIWRSFIVDASDYTALTACGYWAKFVQDDLVFWRSFIVDARDYICGNQQAHNYTALDCLWVLTKICSRWPCLLKVIYCWCSWLHFW